MRKETEAIKKQYNQQIQDLRRQLITKKAYDEEEAHKEITRLKKELQFIQRNGVKKGKGGSDLNAQQTKENTVANAFKRPETAKPETLELKNKITQLERRRLNHNANVIGPLSAMSQSEMGDYSSNRFGGKQGGGNDSDIGPGFFARMGGSGPGTVLGDGQRHGGDESYNYSEF